MLNSWRDPYGRDYGLFARGCVHKGKGGSAPAAPDPAATAAAQSAANKDTAITQAELNMVNQTDAFGNKLTYNPIGKSDAGNPRYEAIQTLSPEQQALANKTQAIYGQALDTGQTLFNNAQAGLSSPAPTYDDAYRQQQLSAILQRNQPQLDQQKQALEQQLANQGITLGSAAYDQAMDQYNRGVNDFRLAADAQSGNEARSQYQAMLAGRSQPINELSALLGLGQVQSPQFASTPQTGVANTDVIGPTNLAYQGQLAGWQNGQANNRATMGALAGLGGSALGGWAMGALPFAFSDVRTKKNIEHIGYTKVPVSVPVYRYDYKWEGDGQKHVGVMAQELEQVRPDAVHDIGGVKAVNYGVFNE